MYKVIQTEKGLALQPPTWRIKTSSYQGEGEIFFFTEREAEKKYYELMKYEGQLQAHTEKPEKIDAELIRIADNQTKWKEGDDVKEGEFEIKLCDCTCADKCIYNPLNTGFDYRCKVAIPKQEKKEDESELWKEAVYIIKSGNVPSIKENEIIERLKKHYTITRKQ